MADDQLILPIIDSHIHLYPDCETSNVNWLTPDHALNGQHSVDEFRLAAKSSPSLLGFVLVEVDRKSDVTSGTDGWEGPLMELRYAKRIALGEPKDGEGHSPDDAALCLAIVPWAPLPSGVEIMEKYLALIQEEAGEAWPKVKGFRYLAQDKPHGVMLEQDFIDGLKLLGRKGFIFEVGVDHHRRGKKQLDEMLEMIDRAHAGVPEDEKVTFIISKFKPSRQTIHMVQPTNTVTDHLCKPDLGIFNLTSDPNFHAWRNAIYTLSQCSKTYMKLSGLNGEMPASLKKQPAAQIFQDTLGWLGVILATFGPSRIMFGSDWPVCTDGVDDAWARWRDIVEKMCWMATMADEDRAMIFGGTAKKAYGL